jgi:hypothetical protein
MLRGIFGLERKHVTENEESVIICAPHQALFIFNGSSKPFRAQASYSVP